MRTAPSRRRRRNRIEKRRRKSLVLQRPFRCPGGGILMAPSAPQLRFPAVLSYRALQPRSEPAIRQRAAEGEDDEPGSEQERVVQEGFRLVRGAGAESLHLAHALLQRRGVERALR